MEIAADDLRLEGRKPWTNACPHPAEAHRWRYLPVFDYLSGQLVCTRCGQALAGAASTY